MSALTARYGTPRGLVRLLLSHVQRASGRASIARPDPARVRRLVFVCQGNICRSAFADVVARRLGAETASFGLSTSAGAGAHPPAIAAAAALGVDLRAHRTSRVEDYVPREGDLLLAMEVRQLARIARDPRLAHLPRSLLGLWARPRRPHLHDPYKLDDRYMMTCLRVIEGAVTRLVADFPGAGLS
ncbi:MAG TPA: phosphotyrosine protein phosphatase [Sphingomonas sp.]